MPKRIIPVSSGKGGVGKTTVATNFALSLSRYAPTLLVDLDTGTSSVRNTIGVPVERDLYHFFKKGLRLDECITALPASWDPDGLYAQFGFVAAPLHLIEEVTNFGPERKAQLSEATRKSSQSRPSESGRTPLGSRKATIPSGVITTVE